MKVLFMGTPAFAAASLRSLHDAGHTCVAVVTRPDAPAGRGLKTRTSPVKDVAMQLGLRVLQPATLRGPGGEAVRAACEALAPDCVVVVAYGRILPQRLLDLPPRGAVNVHASLLPKYRGAAPIAWAIARGEARTGCTTMKMTAELDAGDILLQDSCPIEAHDTAGTLEERLAVVGADLIVRTLDAIEKDAIEPVRQDPAQVTWAPILTKQDGRIDWTESAVTIERKVRAFDPWPGAWTVPATGGRLRIWSARPLRHASRSAVPGGAILGPRVEDGEEGVEVACGAGEALLLREVQPAGSRRMSAKEAAAGRRLPTGGSLG